MKGVNLKRIGAIVAGATILASSVAFAGPVLYGDTVLVTESGQPVVKVVVGAGGAASDGVGAANIAAHLAHEAYKSDVYTAKVDDSASCTLSGALGCTITDKKVTLEVTVPGATKTGTYTLNTLVGDYIDRTLLDRGVSSQTTYTLSTAETSTLANPTSDGGSSYLSSTNGETYLYRITGTDFSPMATYTVEDVDGGGTYTETQNFWLGSTSNGGNIKYVDSADNLVLNMPTIMYSMKFADSTDMGIPVCTQATNTSLYATCDTSYQTETHKVKVMFLGEPWIISDMSAPTTSTTTEQTVTPGGYIKLAKESVQDVLNKGEYLTVGDLKFVLDDVSLATGTTNVHPAIMSVYAEGTEAPLKEVQIDPATTQDVTVPGYGTYKIHVYKTAPGYTFGATWADIAVFSQELKLQDSSDLDADLNKNDYWKVALGWKNRGATSSDTAPDHLRTIILFSDEVSDLLGEVDQWTPGLSVPVVQDPANWQLTFAGLNIDDSDRGALEFTMERQTQKQISINSTAKCNITAPYVKVKVPNDNKMTMDQTGTVTPVDDSSSSAYNYEAYIALSPDVGTGTNAIVCDSGYNFTSGSVAMKTGTTSTSYYVVGNASTSGVVDIKWDYMGAGVSWSTGGVIRVGHNITYANAGNFSVDFSGETTKLYIPIAISEETGEGESTNMEGKYVWGVNYSGTAGATSTFNFDGASTTYFYKDHVYAIYAGPAYTSNGTVEEGYITERGSKFVSIDDTSVKFKIADQVAHAQVTLSTSEAATTSAETVTLANMEEGEERTVSGTSTKVKVKSIDATGTCNTGAGGTPACTASGAASAYLQNSAGQNVGASKEVMTPYSGSMELVVLDSDVSAGTLISVGGPVVNTVTEEAQAEGNFALEAEGDVVVKKVGNTIVVAGYTAEDTLDAVDAFLADLD